MEQKPNRRWPKIIGFSLAPIICVLTLFTWAKGASLKTTYFMGVRNVLIVSGATQVEAFRVPQPGHSVRRRVLLSTASRHQVLSWTTKDLLVLQVPSSTFTIINLTSLVIGLVVPRRQASLFAYGRIVKLLIFCRVFLVVCWWLRTDQCNYLMGKVVDFFRFPKTYSRSFQS